MRSVCVICLLSVIGLSAIVFGQKRRTRRLRTSPKATTAPKDEAADLVAQNWAQFYAKCGESYYLKYNSHEICEYRDVRVVRKDLPVTEADRLNGIERRVESSFEYKVSRCYERSWLPWQSGQWGVSLLRLGLIKKNDNWEINREQFNPYTVPDVIRLQKISCSDVPH